jgi:hypothetical protein
MFLDRRADASRLETDALMTRKKTTYRRANHVTKRRVGETTYLIDAHHNTIHQLNPVGAAIWDQLADPTSTGDLVEMLHIAFEDVDYNVIERDAEDLIDELVDAELIVRSQ